MMQRVRLALLQMSYSCALVNKSISSTNGDSVGRDKGGGEIKLVKFAKNKICQIIF